MSGKSGSGKRITKERATRSRKDTLPDPRRRVTSVMGSNHMAVSPLPSRDAPAELDRPTTPMQRVDLLGGRYKLVEQLGQGATGTVWKAVHRDLGKAVAVKIVHADTFERSVGRELFLHEARTASSLDHPNIVAVTDFGIDPHLGAFLVMELLAGETLRTRMKREGRLLLQAAYDVLHQLLDALRFVHGRDVVHCDIKPDNLFLVAPPGEPHRRNHLRIVDFGLASVAGRGAFENGGTPPYLAPERLRGGRPDVASDLYAAGAVLYELCTGRAPFDALPLEEWMNRVGREDPAPPTILVGTAIPAKLSALIVRSLSRDPGKRPRSAEAFLGELRSLMDAAHTRVRLPSRPMSVLPPQLFAGTPFPLAITSELGRVIACNPAFAVAVAVAPSDLPGRHIDELFPAGLITRQFEQVAYGATASASVTLPDRAAVRFARVEEAGAVHIHVMIIK
ncbi:MAG: serine/threonine protein kinase [Myxococcales bacterium]|nr:serine/threonine protein kinase [Myxococcales bacterium]